MSSAALSTYIELLKSYNEHTNIYSKGAYHRLDFHLNDCQCLAALIQNQACRVLDIGSGSGLPAVVLAICNPNNQIRAVESKSRKTRFLAHVKEQLSLHNLEIIQANIVEYAREAVTKADVVTAKAYASLEKVEQVSRPLRHQKSVIWIPISKLQAQNLNVKKSHVVQRDDFYYAKWQI